MWTVAAICIPWETKQKERVALIQRPRSYPHPLSGKWFFPGGVVEIGEQPIEAAERETQEEAGIIVNNLQLLDVYSYREFWEKEGQRLFKDVTLIVYEGFYSEGTLSIQDESEAVEWVEKKDLASYIDKSVMLSHLTPTVLRILELDSAG